MSAQVKLRYLDKTVRSEKKRTVESLVSRLVAHWIIYGVIAEMLPAYEGLRRLENHPLIARPAKHNHTERECLSLAGVHGISFELRGKKTRDGVAGWMAAKWMKELGENATSEILQRH